MSKKTILIILAIILVILLIGGGIAFVLTLSQPTLPAKKSTTTPTPLSIVTVTLTPSATTTATTTPTVSVTPSVTISATATPTTVNTSGGLVDGVITNICGGKSSATGIADSQGTCGRCVNVGGTDGYCTPHTGEEVVVLTCDTKTGINCKTTGTEAGKIFARNLTAKTYVSDYLTDGCTIEFDIVKTGGDITKTDAVIDYLTFQLDQCATTATDATPTATSVVTTTITATPTVTALPKTAIISDEIDVVIIGLLAVLFGVILWRSNIPMELLYRLNGKNGGMFSPEEKTEIERLHEVREAEAKKLQKEHVIEKFKRERAQYSAEVLKETEDNT
jgi:hypothetical protein